MLNEALRLVRIYSDKNQTEMADALGISKSYLSELEKGTKTPTLQLLQRYSKVLGVPLSSILFFAEEIEGVPHPTRTHAFVAEKVLRFLKFAARDDEIEDAEKKDRTIPS